MQIEKVILMRENGMPIYIFTKEGEVRNDEEESLMTGMLSAIDSFSEELLEEGLCTYETEKSRITLLKKDQYVLAILSDRESLRDIPTIVKEYLLAVMEEGMQKELHQRLRSVFWPQLRPEHRCKGLILTVGRTMGPIWFAISRHAPEIVAFLVSEQSRDIAITATKFFGLELEKNAKLFLCDPNNTTSITTAALQALAFLEKQGINREDLLVNTTGGTKGMTIAMAHISYSYGISVYYVKSSAQSSGENKIFGDEEIRILDNPSESVGIYFEDIAKGAFNSYEFLKAKEYFERLRGVFDANRRNIYQALKYLSEAYHKWDLFDFKGAANRLTTALKLLEQNLNSEFGRAYRGVWEKLQKQNEILTRLQGLSFSEKEPLPDSVRLVLYFELMNNAKRRVQQKKYDDAVCRFYRLLEATAQLLLWKKYHINVSKFAETADKLPVSAKSLFKQSSPKTPFLFLNALVNLFQGESLPPVISLKKSRQLLEQLDPQIKKLNLCARLDTVLPIRNQSILAHGWIPIRAKSIKTFNELISQCVLLVREAFQEYLDVQNLEKLLEFVQLE